jgi:type I restriction-modification system DNA methylase subunit
MKDVATQMIDIEIGPHDIQALNGPDAVAAFFARLGYNTDARTLQTANNLGITAEGTSRPIKKIDLIADQETLFQIYLFELTSVTISHTRALARTFRNRAGNYLLVLTSDYEHLDFVLLEKYLPGNQRDAVGIATKQVSIRPRILTVERRKPSRVHLRVLRRFTWTEFDPFAQYDKLLSAYAVADWSEEYFNNRALFSDYYLLERLPRFPVWAEDPRPPFLGLRKLYQGAMSRFAGKGENLLRQELLEPALRILGFEFKPGKKSGKDTNEPDFRLFYPEKLLSPIGLCLIYPWGRSLDGKDDQRDKETPEENPGSVVVSLLEKGEAPWVVVTNGKLWRLYAQHAHSRATNYYEVDLEEILAQSGPQAGDPSETFRYFWVLFHASSFLPAEKEREGRKISLSLLDQLLLESEDYAKELGERLKGRVFEEIFPHLALGFISYIQRRDGQLSDFSRDELDEIFQGTLTFLYRLLFLLYAEARDLLPVKEVRGYFEVSLTKLKREVADTAGTIVDEAEDRLKKHFRDDQFELYDRLTHLFSMVDKGDSALNVPVYNGGLFLSDPAEDNENQDARVTRFLNTTKVADRFLSQAVNHLTRDIDQKRHDLVFIDYKSLGVRQLGSIYEGLLEFKLRIADRKLAIVKEKGREVFVPFNELDEKNKERADRQGYFVKKGHVYLENDKRERKATGSYYTPDRIVKYIVDHAVGPVLQKKFETLRPKLREAQLWHKDMVVLGKKKGEPISKYELGPTVDKKWRNLVDELFNLKVLDPAMGSGHFLVEVVDYVTDKTLDFLNAFPWNPIFAHLALMRETILQEMDDQGITIDSRRLTDVNLLKRQVLKRCIYGVDLNPMAVELAKVSLWLDCFTLGAPLSFLNHHLKCGNSLIGVSVKEVKEAVEPGVKIVAKEKLAASSSEWKEIETRASQLTLFGSRFAGLLLATDLMRHVGELSDITSAQVLESRTEFGRASDALVPFKRILDVYTSQWFGNANLKSKEGRTKAESPAIEFLKSRKAETFITAQNDKALSKALEGLSIEDRIVTETALKAAKGKRFFHWELEFPEVFYGPRLGTTQVIERIENAGFDAVIGNPPYDVLEKERGIENWPHENVLNYIKNFTKYKACLGGKLNLYRPFMILGLNLVTLGGYYSQIIPMSFMGDYSLANTRRYTILEHAIISITAFPQKDDPHRRVFFEAKLSTCIPVIKRDKAGHGSHFVIRTYPANTFDDTPMECFPIIEDLMLIDPEFLPIPIRTQVEIKLASKIHRECIRLRDVANIARGEINQTVFRKFITTNLSHKPLLKGAEIRMFGFNIKLSQGQKEYFDKKSYEGQHKQIKPVSQRIATQRITGVDEAKRLVCAISRNSSYFADSTNSIIPNGKNHIWFLLGLLNSNLLNWRFSLTSTNNNVGTNELEMLPYPKTLSEGQIERVTNLVKKLEEIEMQEKPEENRLNLLKELNSEVYSIYGITNEEIGIVAEVSGGLN